MTQEEKVLILAALFHDIGKFEQRCTNQRIKHQELGARLIDDLNDQFVVIVDTGVNQIKELILNHHNKDKSDKLLDIIKTADHLSASERVGFDEEDDWKDKWSHKHLSSLFSKISLNNSEGKHQRYYSHKLLNKKNYKILIPEFTDESDLKESDFSYNQSDWNSFKEQLKSVLDFYQNEDDFDSLINLILILFEKYMWCIPDFTGSANTDISLYNHLKDVTGIATALYKSDNNNNLNLIIGDLPGIQNYIFNVSNRKPAKVLRGRSIFVQILTRQFASIILKGLKLTEANLIMLAGGKFYILAPNNKSFEELLLNAITYIEEHLVENFNYQLSFSASHETFNHNDLMKTDKKRLTFGDIIDRASYKLLLNRNRQFKNVLFKNGSYSENSFILDPTYMDAQDIDTNKIKDAVTGLPIRMGREKQMPDSENIEMVDKQVYNEIKIGSEAPQSNVIILFENDNSTVKNVLRFSKYNSEKNESKILLNPDLDELLDNQNIKKDILRNTQIIEVANYSSWDEKENHVLDFAKLEQTNNGAYLLTLIKGDVDNLGLIMSSGLNDDEKDLTAISRTTTLSNHLKYFFSFTLNGFLEKWENGLVNKEIEDNYTNDQKVYTVFAGGDDLMLVCPHSSSLKLVNELNKTFTDFVCENPEVHISYSLTNFRHSTPIRIVNDMAEDNQEEIKKILKSQNLFEMLEKDREIFHSSKDKAGVRLFETNIKNNLISKLNEFSNDLIKWEKDEKNKVTQGVLRNLLYFSKIMKDFEETNDTRFLLWHPKLNYMINRLLKNNEGKYINQEIESFFDNALKINKKESSQALILEKLFYPVVCEAIYGTRNLKGE